MKPETSEWIEKVEGDLKVARRARLSVFDIASRYPGRQADREAAEDSMKRVEMIRTILRSRVGLP